MESLQETLWDVVLSGTGLSQSLLALALSRSGKNVLHVDRHDYYGGTEAALSLQEIEAWVDKVNDATRPSPFRNAVLQKAEQSSESIPGLGFSRAYSIPLSPRLIYARSNLLPALVSSKVHAQLEFLAVGSWWIYNKGSAAGVLDESTPDASSSGELRRIPGGREDVFSDKSIDLRASRSLMKFLKLATDTENHPSILEQWGSKPFPDFLSSELKIPELLQAPLLALTSSSNPPKQTLTSFALPRIYQHLTSIGLFGPGFGAVLPKWGGLSEVAQVGCRAGAVGGGVYVLNKAVEAIELSSQSRGEETLKQTEPLEPPLTIRLDGEEAIKAHWVVGSYDDLPLSKSSPAGFEEVSISHSITIVSSALSSLFHLAAEGAPPPAATVVVFPTSSLSLDGSSQSDELPPVYLAVHSSDTGECPSGQSIIYGHTSLPQPQSSTLLALATQTLLKSLPLSLEPAPAILWTLHYSRLHRISNSSATANQPSTEDPVPSASVGPSTDASTSIELPTSGKASAQELPTPRIITLPSLPPGLALDDSVLKTVRGGWAQINGGDDGTFMLFQERAGVGEAAEDEDSEEDNSAMKPAGAESRGEKDIVGE